MHRMVQEARLVASLSSAKQYWRLLPKVFFVNGVVAEEKVVRFALSYMSKDSAASWSERMSERTPFPFPTWALFVTEFKLRFVEENEQDHTLAQLETHQYYMGSRNIFKYMDEYDDLLDLAGYTDNLVKVTKYRTGLDPRINQAITTSTPSGVSVRSGSTMRNSLPELLEATQRLLLGRLLLPPILMPRCSLL
ncbi:unnamed protein product [Mycena citricolor]|uniref:Retrotransposon gag domain-containing protein n=1 Tax=Mycena citricolor TaxID=2018698 RepID=A0AAD2GWA4_9AGAR|nr:unnamed protein product [Mycena citricolor]